MGLLKGTILLEDQERRKHRKPRKSKSEEKVVVLDSHKETERSHPERNHGTRRIDQLTWRRTQGVVSSKVGRTSQTAAAFLIHPRKTRKRARVPWPPIMKPRLPPPQIYLYLLIWHNPYPATGLPRNNAKKRNRKGRTKKKRIGAEGETIHSNSGNWSPYGGKEKNRRRRK